MSNNNCCSNEKENTCCKSNEQPTGCGCGCEFNSNNNNIKYHIIRLLFCFIILIILMILTHYDVLSDYLKYTLFILLLLFSGYDIFLSAFKNILKGKVFKESFLITIACIGAFIISEMFEGIIIVILFGVGEILQQRVTLKSRNKIKDLMNLKPDMAYVKTNDKIIPRALEDVNINDILIIKPGEKVGLDGIVISGSSFIDTSNLTGESVPVKVKLNDFILSGSINTTGLIEVKVTKLFKDSTVSKILEMVEKAQSKKAVSEKFITKFAKVYTPVVVIIALVIAVFPPLFFDVSYSDYIYKSLSFLLISCPCALVISIPVTIYGAIGCAAKDGILIKGGNYLESLYNLNTLVFDKTGTLTKGIFEVSKIISNDNKIIEYAAIAEQNSNHPIAKSILNYYNKEITANILSYKEISGMGVEVETSNEIIHAGNIKLMKSLNINNIDIYDETTVYIAVNKIYIGCILISDQLKDNTKEVIKNLRDININNIIMLTGDNDNVAKRVSNDLVLNDYKANLLPHNKVEEFECFYKDKKKNEVYGFVGDGINDSPVLMMSDIGIAMGGIGSDAAIEAADIVIMNDDLEKIVTAKKIANKARKIIIQNIIFSLGVKLLIMSISIIFTLPIVFAILGDVGVSIIAILNARRSMRIK